MKILIRSLFKLLFGTMFAKKQQQKNQIKKNKKMEAWLTNSSLFSEDITE